MSKFNVQRHNKVLSQDGTELRIGCRFSYCHLFSPKNNQDGTKGKYGVCLLIPKEDADTNAMVSAAIQSAIDIGVKSTWGGKKPFNLKTPLRDGDAEHPGEDGFEGFWFMNGSASRQPGIQVKEKGQAPCEAFDEGDFYSGCWGAATITLKAYESNGNKGVACYVNNVCKTEDDESLAGGRSAAADFADLAD